MMAEGFVYLVTTDDVHFKVGRSKDPDGRLSQLDNGPHPLRTVHRIASDDPGWLERRLHRKYALRHVRGEWFTLDALDVAEICAMERCDRPPLLAKRKPKKRRGPRRQRQWVDRSRPQGIAPFPSAATVTVSVEAFGDRLRRLRAEAGLSQAQLAEKSGIPIGTIRTWEQRLRVPLATALPGLIAALDCSPYDLLGIERKE